MSHDLRIPIVQEEARVSKRLVQTDRVNVRVASDQEDVIVRDELRQERVDITRVPIDCEVSEAPATRTEGDVTIVPVLEERLVVEKRLFLVEELHLRRTATINPVDLPMTLRRTRVEIERYAPDEQENS